MRDIDRLAERARTLGVVLRPHLKTVKSVDAGWMAMSRDRGTETPKLDQGYGVVCDVHGNVLPDLVVLRANQEHGVIARRPRQRCCIARA